MNTFKQCVIFETEAPLQQKNNMAFLKINELNTPEIKNVLNYVLLFFHLLVTYNSYS